MRIYDIPYSVSCAGVVDLVSAQVAAGRYAEFIGFTCNDIDAGSSLPTSQQLAVNAFLLTGSIGGRTGGTATTCYPRDPGDSSAQTTARMGDTTLATGTLSSEPYSGGCYVTQGIDKTFTPESVPGIGGEMFVVRLTAAPAGTINLAGVLTIGERGG